MLIFCHDLLDLIQLFRSGVQFLVGAHDIYTQSEGNPTFIQAQEFAEVGKTSLEYCVSVVMSAIAVTPSPDFFLLWIRKFI